MSRLFERARREDSGFAMITVVLMGVVMITMTVLTTTQVQNAMRTGTGHVAFEREIHLAETGIDLTLARLQKSPTWSNATANPNSSPTPAEEEAWARAALTVATPIAADGGEYAIVKPIGRNVVYAAGWSPTRATSQRTRVVKAEYLFSTYSPANAVLSDGDLKIGGNAAVQGTLGNVHANGSIDVVGNSLTVEGTLTATGTVSGGSSSWLGNQAPQEVPEISPRAVYDRFATSTTDNGTYSGNWYDLCPDGTARTPSTGGPCTGTSQSLTGGKYRGWSFSNGTWKNDREPVDGIYYVYQASASVKSTGELWRATILTEAEGTEGNLVGGDIEMTGKPNIIGYLPDIALVAGRDLDIQGTGSGDGSYEGLLGAHEQFKVTGNPTLMGALVSENATDTNGSPVDENYVSGSMTITHNEGLEADLGGLIRTTLWLEL